jgi:hypothetical protein
MSMRHAPARARGQRRVPLIAMKNCKTLVCVELQPAKDAGTRNAFDAGTIASGERVCDS